MANEIQTWKGAVEPAEFSPSGNEVQTWKGAVEPAVVDNILAITTNTTIAFIGETSKPAKFLM